MSSRDTERRTKPTISAIALWLSMATQASAVEIALLERAAQTDDLHTCGVYVSGSAALEVDNGLGIDGGMSDSTVDGTEWLEFDLDEPQSGVYFDVIHAEDFDGDGTAGRAIVEAFDPGGSSLGFQLIQGTGIKELATAFGSSPVSRVVVTAVADGIRLASFGYDEVGSVEVDLRNGGYSNAAISEPTVCGVRVAGSYIVYYADMELGANSGMGVVGGFGATTLDGSEWMRLEFPYPVDELVLESLLYGLDGDFFYGEAVLFAYDETGSSLGSTSLTRHSLFGGPIAQTIDVVDRLGVGGIAEVEIYSLGDARRLDRVVYAPEPSMGGGAAILTLAAIARRHTRRRPTSPIPPPPSHPRHNERT